MNDLFTSDEVPDVRSVPKAVTYCAFGFLTALGLRERILRNLAFFPPKPPGYGLSHDGLCYLTYWNSCLRGIRGFQYVSDHCDSGPLPISALTPDSLHITYEVLPGKKYSTPAFVVRHVKRVSSRPLIIYAHGNATDIGGMAPAYVALAERAHVDVIGFEYSGYGLADGLPSEQNCFANARAAYKYARETLRIPPQHVIVLGQSLGSAAATDLAADPATPIGGLILQSGLASAVRIIHADVESSPFFDAFTNVGKLTKLSSSKTPVLVLHGRADDQVPCRHGRQLFLAAAASGASGSQNGSTSRRCYCCCRNPSMEGRRNQRGRNSFSLALLASSRRPTDKFELPPLLTVGVEGHQILSNPVYEVDASDGQVRFVLIERAGHNNLEDVMGAAYYHLIRCFSAAAANQVAPPPARVACIHTQQQQNNSQRVVMMQQ